MFERRKKCSVLFPLEKKRRSFQSILVREISEFSPSIVVENRYVVITICVLLE